MRQSGFTLVELIIVIAIMAILLSIATLNWNEMQRKSAIESETKTMYTDLMSIRLEALYTKRARSVTISGSQFSVYSSNVTTSTMTPVLIKTMKYPLTWRPVSTKLTLTFDASGLATGSERSICVDPFNDLTVDNPGAVDSVVISTARINMGKRQSGGNCATGSIDQK